MAPRHWLLLHAQPRWRSCSVSRGLSSRLRSELRHVSCQRRLVSVEPTQVPDVCRDLRLHQLARSSSSLRLPQQQCRLWRVPSTSHPRLAGPSPRDDPSHQTGNPLRLPNQSTEPPLTVPVHLNFLPSTCLPDMPELSSVPEPCYVNYVFDLSSCVCIPVPST